MPNSIVKLNPENLAPLEIVKHVIPVEVPYVDFKGEQKTGTIEVHEDVADDVHQFFVLAFVQRFPIDKVVKSSNTAYLWDDKRLTEDNATSGFNYRVIKDTDKLSLHSQGLALDVNTRLNPFVRYNHDGTVSVDPEGAVYNPTLPGTLTADHPLVIFMKERGWEWGGDWDKASGRTDYQHFQKSLI